MTYVAVPPNEMAEFLLAIKEGRCCACLGAIDRAHNSSYCCRCDDACYHEPKRRWVADDHSRIIARRARKRRFCECSSGGLHTRIEPGEVYLRHVLLPGSDFADNEEPWAVDECAACARKHGRGNLIDEREANPR